MRAHEYRKTTSQRGHAIFSRQEQHSSERRRAQAFTLIPYHARPTWIGFQRRKKDKSPLHNAWLSSNCDLPLHILQHVCSSDLSCQSVQSLKPPRRCRYCLWILCLRGQRKHNIREGGASVILATPPPHTNFPAAAAALLFVFPRPLSLPPLTSSSSGR